MAMISRRKIISRSQSELDYTHNFYDVEEDVWFNKDKLFQDHIAEILKKWDKIDDEIWAKIIVMERNRRVAKAYARAPTININGSESGFDGYSIGINGFEPGSNDPEALNVKKMIGKGVKLRMDESGNIDIKRVSRCGIIVKSAASNKSSDSPNLSAISPEILKGNGRIELDKVVRLFDMKKFIQNIDRELRNAYPDRKKLENQCIILIAFARDTTDILDLPCYVMIINIVAIDMLKSKIPSGSDRKAAIQSRFNPMMSFDDKEIIEDDDEMYASFNMEHEQSMHASHANSRLNSSGQQPNRAIKNNNLKSILQPSSSSNRGPPPKVPPKLPPRNFANSTRTEPEDPYYCGLEARVPNFANKQRKSLALPSVVNSSSGTNGHHPRRHDFVTSDHNQSKDLRKTHSNGYLNSLFNQSSSSSSATSNFLRSKFSKTPSTATAFNNGHHHPGGGSYYDSSLESDGYSGGVTTSGSGYDGIYAPISSPGTGYGRYNPQRNGQQVNGSHLIVGNLKSNNNNNNSSKNNGNLFSHIRNKQVNNNQRVNSRDEDESFEPHTQRYATEWD